MDTKIETKFQSSLVLKEVFVEKTIFTRNVAVPLQGKLVFDFNHEIEEKELDEVHVRLHGEVKNDEGSIEVSATIFASFIAGFSGDYNDEIKKAVKENSTLAIMFPYLRTQIALVSSQSGINNLCVPAININAYLDAKKKQAEEVPTPKKTMKKG